MITQRLKEETRPNHEHTEEIAYSKEIMSRTLTAEEYRKLITNTYFVHSVIENQVEKIEALLKDSDLELDTRKKSHLLEKDLQNLGLEPSKIAAPSIEFNISTLEEALGAMYVLEGSTLGGMYIYKALQRNPNLEKENISEFNYYNCYGEATRDRWAKFQEVLVKYAANKESEDAIVENAKRTFDYLSEVFQASKN